jgi:predicted alpha/beta-fold hydrolase
MTQEPKHILIVHGYLFEGSGSNIYVKNIAMSWKKMGYNVTVVCQDRHVAKLEFVNSFIQGDFP